MVFFGILFGSQETEVYPMITYEIPCLLGLEKLVADEIKRLGLADVRAENGRVLCQGSWADCARLNINLRCGARVIALL